MWEHILAMENLTAAWKELARMKKATARVIKPRVDRVRYYYLCARCLRQTEVTSGVEVLHEEPGAIIV